ncbi:MAG: hypothetical protein J5781_03985, partial [Clostridia bacterium]|nr:hypothetical protein [Clostridia bacterium]
SWDLYKAELQRNIEDVRLSAEEIFEARFRLAMVDFAYDTALAQVSGNEEKQIKARAYERLEEFSRTYAASTYESLMDSDTYKLVYMLWFESMIYSYVDPAALTAKVRENSPAMSYTAEELVAIRKIGMVTPEAIREYNKTVGVMLNEEQEVALTYYLVFDMTKAYLLVQENYGDAVTATRTALDLLSGLLQAVGKKYAQAGLSTSNNPEDALSGVRTAYREKIGAIIAMNKIQTDSYASWNISAEAWTALVGNIDFTSYATFEDMKNDLDLNSQTGYEFVEASMQTEYFWEALKDIYEAYNEKYAEQVALASAQLQMLLPQLFDRTVSIEAYAQQFDRTGNYATENNIKNATAMSDLPSSFSTDYRIYPAALAFAIMVDTGKNVTDFCNAAHALLKKDIVGSDIAGYDNIILDYAVAYGYALQGGAAFSAEMAGIYEDIALDGDFSAVTKSALGLMTGSSYFTGTADMSMTVLAGVIDYWYDIKAKNADFVSTVKSNAYDMLIRISADVNRYKELNDIRYSVVFEALYRNDEETRIKMRDTITSSAFSAISDIASGITGEKSFFSTDNIDIYTKMYADLATDLGNLYENIKKDIDGDGTCEAVAAVYETVMKALTEKTKDPTKEDGIFVGKLTSADFAQIVDIIVNSKDRYYEKTADTAVSSGKKYYVLKTAEVTLWDIVPVGEYFEKDGDKYYLTEDTEFLNKDYYIFEQVASPVNGNVGIYYEYKESSIYAGLVDRFWYAKTSDVVPLPGKTYYTIAQSAVTAGNAVPANTYYVSENGKYVLTDDTQFQSGKTYYVATAVGSPVSSAINNYYEYVDSEFNAKINEFVAAIDKLAENAISLSSLAEDMIRKYSSDETVVTMLRIGYTNLQTYLQGVVDSYREVISNTIVTRYRTGSTIKSASELATTVGDSAKEFFDSQWYSENVIGTGIKEEVRRTSTTREYKETGSSSWVTSTTATDSKGKERITYTVEYKVTVSINVNNIKQNPLIGSSSLNALINSGATGIKLTSAKEYNQKNPEEMVLNTDYRAGDSVSGIVFEKSGNVYSVTTDETYSSGKTYYHYPQDKAYMAKQLTVGVDYEIGEPVNNDIYVTNSGKYKRTSDSAYKAGTTYYSMEKYNKKLSAGRDYEVDTSIGNNVYLYAGNKYTAASGNYQSGKTYYYIAPVTDCLEATAWVSATYESTTLTTKTGQIEFDYDKTKTDETDANENAAWNTELNGVIYPWAASKKDSLSNECRASYNSAIEDIYDYIDTVISDVKTYVSSMSTADELLNFSEKALSDINSWNVKKYEEATYYKPVVTAVGDSLAGTNYYVYNDALDQFVATQDTEVQSGVTYYAYSFVPSAMYEKVTRNFGSYTRDTYVLTKDTAQQSGKTYYKQSIYKPKYGDSEIGLSVLSDWKNFKTVNAGTYYKQKDQLYYLINAAATISADYSNFYSSLTASGKNVKDAADAIYGVLNAQLYGKTSTVTEERSRAIFYALYKAVYGSGASWLDSVYGNASLNTMFNTYTDILSDIIIAKYGEYGYQAVDRAIRLPGMPIEYAFCSSEEMYKRFWAAEGVEDVFNDIIYKVVYSDLSGEEMAILALTFYNVIKDRDFALSDFNVWKAEYGEKHDKLLLTYMGTVFENLIQHYSAIDDVRNTGTAFVNAYDNFTLAMANKLINLYVNDWQGTENFDVADDEKLNSVVSAISKLSRSVYAEYASFVDFAAYINGIAVLNEAGKRKAWYAIVSAIENNTYTFTLDGQLLTAYNAGLNAYTTLLFDKTFVSQNYFVDYVADFLTTLDEADAKGTTYLQSVTSLYQTVNTAVKDLIRLKKDAVAYVGSESAFDALSSFRKARVLLEMQLTRAYGVSGVSGAAKEIFNGYAAETTYNNYLVYKSLPYANGMIAFLDQFEGLAGKSDFLAEINVDDLSAKGKAAMTAYAGLSGITDISEKANVLINLAIYVFPNYVDKMPSDVLRWYNNAGVSENNNSLYAVMNSLSRVSEYLTESIWQTYFADCPDYYVVESSFVATSEQDGDAVPTYENAVYCTKSGNTYVKATGVFAEGTTYYLLKEANGMDPLGTAVFAVKTTSGYEVTTDLYFGNYYSTYPIVATKLDVVDKVSGIDENSTIGEVNDLLSVLTFSDDGVILNEYIDLLRKNAASELENNLKSAYGIDTTMFNEMQTARLNARTVAGFDLTLGLSGEHTSGDLMIVNMYDDGHGGVIRSQPDLLQETGDYVDYDEMKLYLSFGGFLTVTEKQGRTNLVALVDLLFSDLDISEIYLEFLTSTVLGGTIDARIALDMGKALSGDEEQIKQALNADFMLRYTLMKYDATGEATRFEQTILSVYIRNGKVYLSMELFDTTLSVALEFDTVSFVMSMMGLSNGESDNSAMLDKVIKAFGSGSDKTPFAQLANAAATGNDADALNALIRLSSSEASMILTVDILLEVLNALFINFKTTDAMVDLVNLVFTQGDVSIEYGDDFGIVLHLFDNKKTSEGSSATDNLGYDFLFGILNDTQFSINPEIYYDDFLAELKEKDDAGFFDAYYKSTFSLIDMIKGNVPEEYGISQAITDIAGTRLQINVDLVMSSEVLKTVIDWS